MLEEYLVCKMSFKQLVKCLILHGESIVSMKFCGVMRINVLLDGGIRK